MSVYQSLLLQLKTSLQQKGVPIIQILTNFEQNLNLQSGLAVELFKHLIARKEIIIDINKPILLHLYIEDLIINEKGSERVVC